jgi:hypothetical protein
MAFVRRRPEHSDAAAAVNLDGYQHLTVRRCERTPFAKPSAPGLDWVAMRGIDASVILVLIPIVFVGIIVVAVVGALDEKTRGDKLSKFFSIASNAAIFFTVLALLYQVIASEEEAKRTSYADALDTYYEINQMQIEHPEVWRLIYPGEAESALLGEDERLALQYTYFTMNFFESLYLLFRDGVIDDERWKAWESWISYSLSNSAMFRNVWDESCGLHHADFVAYVEANYDDGTCRADGGQDDAGVGTPVAAPAR